MKTHLYKTIRPLCLISCLLSMTGCATTSGARIDALIHDDLSTQFVPVSFGQQPAIYGALKQKASTPSSLLWVVFEGDGQAWLTRSIPSRDPTPRHAVGAILASQMSGKNVLYLTRPCQYLSSEELAYCLTRDWTNARFAEKWIQRLNEAIDQTKATTKATHIVLSGYSGGGYIAAVLATQRDDVSALITVAAPLDITAWSTYHQVSQLTGSVNILSAKYRLYSIPQIHLVGQNDDVVPPILTQSFMSGYPKKSPAELVILPGIDHNFKLKIDLSQIRSSSWSSQTLDDLNNGL